MEAIQDVRWVFTVAGVLLIAAAIFEGGLEISEIKIPALSKSKRILSAVVGLGFILLGFFPTFPRSGTSSPSESPSLTVEGRPQIQATIEEPQSDEAVPEVFTARGTVSSSLPEGYSLWILMEDDDGDHYLPNIFQPLPDGSWEVQIELSSSWRGRVASILVILVEGKPDLEQLLQSQESKNVFQLDTDVSLLAKSEITVTGP